MLVNWSRKDNKNEPGYVKILAQGGASGLKEKTPLPLTGKGVANNL
jgi:hypothetical protein